MPTTHITPDPEQTLTEFVADCLNPAGPLGLPDDWNPATAGNEGDVDQIAQLATQAGLLPGGFMFWNDNDDYHHITVDVSPSVRLSSLGYRWATIAGFDTDTAAAGLRALVTDWQATAATLVTDLHEHMRGQQASPIQLETGAMLSEIVTDLRTTGGQTLENLDGQIVNLVAVSDVSDTLGHDSHGWTPRLVTDPLPVALADAITDRGHDQDAVDAFLASLTGADLPWQLLDLATRLFLSHTGEDTS